MQAISEGRLAGLLSPYLDEAAVPADISISGEGPSLPVREPGDVFAKLLAYLDLLLRWNERTNLTAIRDPEQIVLRHFGESLFTGLCLRHLLRPGAKVLDFGAGAGFPGLPIQVLLPDLQVTLAESQHKKAAFLREAVRVLKLDACIWAGRVQALPPGTRFACVTMRAVDRPEASVAAAKDRVEEGGWLVELVAGQSTSGLCVRLPGLQEGHVRLTQSPLFHVEQ